MTLNIGDKVRINDSYPATSRQVWDDPSFAAVRGSVGEVTRVGYYIGVSPVETESEVWDRSWQFLENELDLLEEAHPLKKESVKS